MVLLIGLIGGIAMGAVAGARRTDSSFPVYLASTNPSTVGFFSAIDDPALGLTAGYSPRVLKAVAHLRFVEHSATAVVFDGNIDLNGIKGVHYRLNVGKTPPTVFGSLDGEYSTQDRVTLVEGRLANPDRSDEAVMNAQAARELGLHIGSVIGIPFYTDAQVNSPYDEKPHLVAKVKLVGEVVFAGSVVESDIPGPNAILVRIRAGSNSSAAYRSLEEIDNKVNALPNDSGSAGGVVSLLRPAEIVNFRSMGTTPAVLAAGFVVGAIAALGLTLGASVRRRRRDLALLKALGFTQRQLATSIAWQATVAAVIGIVFGIPFGIVVGRELWTLFAHNINAVPNPTVPLALVLLVGIGALAFANLVAALPARSAASTPTALVLRAE
jgi:hypothetical protein